MNEEIEKKLEELILKNIENNTNLSIERAKHLIDMRATVAHIKNMEK